MINIETNPETNPKTKPVSPPWYITGFITLTAIVATGASINGMWHVVGDVGITGYQRYAFCAVGELTMFTCALQARWSLRTFGTAGGGALAVWIMAASLAVMATTDSHNLIGKMFRLVIPLIAAGLWHLGLATDRRCLGITRIEPIAWRWTRNRVAVWLGLADPDARTLSDVARARRLARMARVRLRLAALEAHAPAWWGILTLRYPRRALAQARMTRHGLAAVEHLRLGEDPTVAQQIRARVTAVHTLPRVTDPTTEPVVIEAPARPPADLEAPADPPRPRKGPVDPIDQIVRDPSRTNPEKALALRALTPGITQARIARLLGVSPQTVSGYKLTAPVNDAPESDGSMNGSSQGPVIEEIAQ